MDQQPDQINSLVMMTLIGALNSSSSYLTTFIITMFIILLPHIKSYAEKLKIRAENLFYRPNEIELNITLAKGCNWTRYDGSIEAKAVNHCIVNSGEIRQKTIDYDNSSDSSNGNDSVHRPEGEFMLGNGIYVDCMNEKINSERDCSVLRTEIILRISHKSMDFLNEFINKCVVDYKRFLNNMNENKTYHFIFKGSVDGKPRFTTHLLSDFSDLNATNYETFDTIFHDHKKQIIDDMDRLKNLEFYRKTGIKRKEGYLFYGEPGTGKTSTVMAMSNHQRRHIIEVSIKRIEDCQTFESIMALTEIGDIKFTQEQVIMLFDEIEIPKESTVKITPRKPKKKKVYDSDDDITDYGSYSMGPYASTGTLNINSILSRLDGIGSNNGLIVVATTNSLEGLPKQLYRDGRLKLIEFKKIGHQHISDMLEHRYGKRPEVPMREVMPAELKVFIKSHTFEETVAWYDVNNTVCVSEQSGQSESSEHSEHCEKSEQCIENNHSENNHSENEQCEQHSESEQCEQQNEHVNGVEEQIREIEKQPIIN